MESTNYTIPVQTGGIFYFPWHRQGRIHESVITYDGHISRPGITELELGPSENSYFTGWQKVSHSCA